MPKKKSFITVTDQFCGAGGSSIGAKKVLDRIGGEISLAMNHWKLAIETHNTNFPGTLHDCTDISACDPRRYNSTDILITSPECTNHSLAKGVKIEKKQMDLFNSGVQDAAAERSRATMWDVCRFAEYHSYNCIIVENVVDARKWVLFDAWLIAMHSLGYNHKCVYLNSMHCHPTPQSRDRMYVVFWKKGNKAPALDYTPVAHCPKCAGNVYAVQTWKNTEKQYGKYKQQYVYCCSTCTSIVEPYYYAAFNCIDWSDVGTKIGERKKPLSDNTVKRIEYGLKKYGKQPFQIQTVNGLEHQHRSRPISEASFTHTTLQSQAFVVNNQHSTGIDFRVRGMGEQVQTVASSHQFNLVTPFLIQFDKTHAAHNGKMRSVSQSLQTHTTRQTMGFVSPIVTILRGTSKAQTANEPLNGVSAGGIHSGILTTEAFTNFLLAYNYSGNQVSHISEATDCITASDRISLVSYKEPQIEDCYYRMLKPPEIKLAMAFDSDYVVLGSGKDQVKQLGNAVTPPAMEWLVQQCIESLQ